MIASSDSKSTEFVASSNIMISESFKKALASIILCLSPPDKLVPDSCNISSYLFGRLFIKVSALAALHAFTTSSSEAEGFT